MHPEKNPGYNADYNYCYSLRKKERKKDIISFIFVRAKPQSLNLKTENLWTPPLCLVWSFVHLPPTELECAVGVNEAVWHSDRRRG